MKRTTQNSNECQSKRAYCPYVETVDRNLIDFDKEKVCCKTLKTNQIYCCMICGKYYQGRDVGSPAYVHSLEENHHIFLSLNTKQFFNLPHGNEVIEPSFKDIINALDPVYTSNDISHLDDENKVIQLKDHFNKKYIIGFIGFNNLGRTDSINCLVQSIGHCKEIRNLLLSYEEIEKISSKARCGELIKRVSMLIRKQWNPTLIKSVISPYELMSELNRLKKSFSIEKQEDLIEFYMFFINALLPLTQSFQGQIQIEEGKKKYIKHCICIPLDLPPMPLYPDQMKEKIIPQLLLKDILKKYDGKTETLIGKRSVKYLIKKLPKYLTFVIKRFERNTFQGDKNITVVEFEDTLDMSDYVVNDSIKQQTNYHLVSAIKHDGGIEDGTYSSFLYHQSLKKWFEINNEEVKEAFFPLIKVSAICLLIYEQDE
ncbi:pre-mRNA-splicing factor SAD1, putative [Entamoeba dispar SAW760]|uniref:Pre-mRNA-splicing factor SAD1, putative n=1 Tax=Entamoeba dispar (strain ATCC PRA-260 / SAW760) TaxID=370354 RepID=B0EKL4_ENTDS|nr:pre-mRNA-splicing factor SAD1, putative [Entamoeba dispar SAW760]EDR24939.1 pre-mRNA-splicing factor SAD1, putative [Entamoeba dispar SAW760]|eukprot:EDR24939.1 pre-mRNA-splicing factor SAD1, putative [Entamoeba dispar SAW760]